MGRIAFDLLGDLYTIPIGGGEAKPLSTGIAWDMQPRYSPNGKWIAFTSDRSGGDNIWIVDRDGANPKQVTKETFRLLTQPAWSPDSDFIVARKHFTSERSLGAGEMWLYHRSGGDGLQLTKKRTGVTTIHDPSNDTAEIFASSEMAKAGQIVAPRIFSTGTILYGAKAPFKLTSTRSTTRSRTCAA